MQARGRRDGPTARELSAAKAKAQPKLYITHDVNQSWVQQAIARGDEVVVVSLPWYVRLWWRLKRLFGKTDDLQAQKQLAEKVKKAFPEPTTEDEKEEEEEEEEEGEV